MSEAPALSSAPSAVLGNELTSFAACAAERGHHPDSPSSLQSSEACPLFQNENRDSLASIAGTLQHKACEAEDPSLCDSEEQQEAVRKCLSYAQQVGAEKYASVAETIVLKEVYLSVGTEQSAGFMGITGGFPDLVYLADTFADILDWKFGRVPVTATKDNLQGIAYALGLFEKYKSLQFITVHFFAPYQGWSDEEHRAKYVHTFARVDQGALELRLRTVVARKQAAVGRLDRTGAWGDAVPKNDLCIYCARKGDCKKLHALVLRSSEKHSDFVQPTELNPLALSKPEQVVMAFRWAGQVEKICAAVKDRCRKIVIEDNLDLGDEVKIVKRTERQLKNVQVLVEGARRHGVTLRELVPLFNIAFTKVEELVKGKAPKGKGAATIRSLQADWNENGATELGKPIYFLQEARSPKEKQANIIQIDA